MAHLLRSKEFAQQFLEDTLTFILNRVLSTSGKRIDSGHREAKNLWRDEESITAFALAENAKLADIRMDVLALDAEEEEWAEEGEC